MFLDTVYERGADDFYERNIRPALLSSRRLIVLATPDAVLRSDGDDWIQREINDFREANGSENILVVRAAGDFLARLPGDLDLTAPNIEIIDLRHDGFWSALSPLRASRLADEWIKLVAPLFDVPSEDMPKLRREQERRQQRLLAAVIGGITGAIGFATTFSWYALAQQRASEQTLENSLFAVSRVIDTASSLDLEEAHVKEKRSMLMTACDLFDNLADPQARVKYEIEVNKCDVDRISSLIDMGEVVRAKTFLSTVEPKIRDRYLEKKDPALADAISSLLDLKLRIDLSSVVDNAENARMLLDNTRDYTEIFKSHLTLSLAVSYSKRVRRLTNALEELDDYKGSAEVIEAGAVLFEAMAKKQQDEEHEGDNEAEQRQNYGFLKAASLWRQLGWLQIEKLNNDDGALDATAKALPLVQTGLGLTNSGSKQYIKLRLEEILVEYVRGTALLNSDRFVEGKAADLRGLEIADKLLTLNVSDEQRKDLEEQRDFLNERIKNVTAALAMEDNP